MNPWNRAINIFISLWIHLFLLSPLFVAIRHYSSLFVTIRHYSSLFVAIRDYLHYLITIRHYSRLFALFGLYCKYSSVFAELRVKNGSINGPTIVQKIVQSIFYPKKVVPTLSGASFIELAESLFLVAWKMPKKTKQNKTKQTRQVTKNTSVLCKIEESNCYLCLNLCQGILKNIFQGGHVYFETEIEQY